MEADERPRIEHVSAEEALALMLAGGTRNLHPFPGEAVLHAARHGRLNMADAVVVWRGDAPAALCWTAKGGADGTERLALLELTPSPGDALRMAVEALLPAARQRGVTRFDATVACEESIIDDAFQAAGLVVIARMSVGGGADVTLSLPAAG
jgi:hypothetical protein